MSASLSVNEKHSDPNTLLSGGDKTDSTLSLDHGDTHKVEQGDERERAVLKLARKFTSQSEQHNYGSPFEAVAGSSLDPSSETFRAKDWAKAFYDLRYSEEEAIPRVAGIAFTNLSVCGQGLPTDFQSTVGNQILKLPSVFGKGAQKIEILRDLDGLILPGEQLCVLGPPGYLPSSSSIYFGFVLINLSDLVAQRC
jgi:hypothetical protein